MSAVCVIGDSDSHGGAVTSSSASTYVNGIKVAHTGSSVSPDPHKGHTGKTVTSSSASHKTFISNKELSITGTIVSCGASLIASNNKTFAG